MYQSFHKPNAAGTPEGPKGEATAIHVLRLVLVDSQNHHANARIQWAACLLNSMLASIAFLSLSGIARHVEWSADRYCKFDRAI